MDTKLVSSAILIESKFYQKRFVSSVQLLSFCVISLLIMNCYKRWTAVTLETTKQLTSYFSKGLEISSDDSNEEGFNKKRSDKEDWRKSENYENREEKANLSFDVFSVGVTYIANFWISIDDFSEWVILWLILQ